MTIQWKQVTLALVVGLLLGATSVVVAFRHHPRGFTLARELQYFTNKLKLTPEQQDQIAAILVDKREKIRGLNQEMGPRFQEIRASTREEIRKILTPEQQKKFDMMKERIRRPFPALSDTRAY